MPSRHGGRLGGQPNAGTTFSCRPAGGTYARICRQSSGDLLSHIQHNTRASSLTRTAKDLSHRAESPLWRPQALVRRATSTGVDQARQPRSLPDSRQDSMHLCPRPLGVVQPLPRGGTAQRRGKSQEVHTPSAWVRRYFSARGGVTTAASARCPPVSRGGCPSCHDEQLIGARFNPGTRRPQRSFARGFHRVVSTPPRRALRVQLGAVL